MNARAAVLLVIIASAGCVPHEYAGITFRDSALDPDIRLYALQAMSGSKLDMFRLGLRYEFGVGIQQDKCRALGLYQDALKTRPGGGALAYQAGIPAQGIPGSISIQSSPGEMEFSPARYRVEILESEGVKQSCP